MPPPMTAAESRLELPASPSAAGLARQFVRDCWAQFESVDTIDSVALCVSELVTNALDHAAPPYELRVFRGDTYLRVEVTDASAEQPVARPLSPAARRGRGIFLVERVATRWGVESTPEGKTVWAEFAV
jgi:anti-sigma regulatory factor (Ser/Thr protein kinase)